MKKTSKHLLASALVWGVALVLPAWAKLPAPSDEAKAKAAEAAAKTAWSGKVDAYKLCKKMDEVAAAYLAQAKKAGTATQPPTATPPCADPGPFVYTPAPPASAPGTAAAPAPAAVAAAPAPAATPAPAKPAKK